MDGKQKNVGYCFIWRTKVLLQTLPVPSRNKRHAQCSAVVFVNESKRNLSVNMNIRGYYNKGERHPFTLTKSQKGV